MSSNQKQMPHIHFRITSCARADAHPFRFTSRLIRTETVCGGSLVLGKPIIHILPSARSSLCLCPYDRVYISRDRSQVQYCCVADATCHHQCNNYVCLPCIAASDTCCSNKSCALRYITISEIGHLALYAQGARARGVSHQRYSR